MEPCGYDSKGNTYYMLDDNRLYRRTPWVLDEPTPPPPVKKGKALRRKSTKRRRVSTAVETSSEGTVEEPAVGVWSCICVTLHDWTVFVNGLEGSNDPDEQAMHAYLSEDVIPVLQKAWVEKEKQRQLQQAVANRKRSSRLDAKIARKKEEEERAAAAQREAEVAAMERRRALEAEKKEKVMHPPVPMSNLMWLICGLIHKNKLTPWEGAGTANEGPPTEIQGTRAP